MPNADIMVELVDPEGTAVAVSEKLAAHQPPGALHRAFSVFLFSADGRMLLQRRAHDKYHSPGVWSNTCCGHPYPGEPPFLAATRRTVEELGAAPTLLAEAGTVTYDLPDPASGLVEKEYNHLFVGRLGAPLNPDPLEVAETTLVTPESLAALVASSPFSVWFPTVLAAARPAIRRTFPDAGW
ncbi:isopentenyl-diphosphate delta-isomerase [Streptomonospora nanhaiensis]|uniref:Isopentenyl-diphosphate Delta-isomerase n=1 Tax=Streptomonospora nanhaiensis TaxID=1323731 RepID=A0A853BUP3_9ACTN|nr:isopentenyl-diphosphate Delta-isomerase [Streptomonospora nanhaiensis]NYI98221.1 isopentenyl-diphosphate delta-isomerase [Streptomonospora nanhaiensis]